MDEWSGLENRRGVTASVGSNPTPSAEGIRNSDFPNTPRLFHFSDDPAITEFIPRPVRAQSHRPAGQEWLNGPLVWAIEEQREYMYLFPRDCPRILIWATNETSQIDKNHWLQNHRAAAFVERSRWQELDNATLYRYELPVESFRELHDAGMWVSSERVAPIGCDTITHLPNRLTQRGVDLRIVESLLPLKHLWQSTLHVSGIRLRNAVGWN